MEQVISDVLVCAGGDRVVPARLRFDTRIMEIKPYGAAPVELSEIRDRKRCEELLKRDRVSVGEKNQGVHDGEGLLLIPGAVDAHVHFNTPGFEYREDVDHASRAAICGGVTAVADMPCTSIPPVTSRSALESKLSAIRGRSCVDMAMWGGISSQLLRDPAVALRHVLELAEAGVIGFKCYMTSGMNEFGDLGRDELVRAARLAQEAGLPLAVHAENRELVRSRERAFQSQGRRDWRAYAESRNDEVEASAISILMDVARNTGAAIHIVHLSSRRGVELIKQAKAEGLSFTAETCPHYLHFAEEDFDNPQISAHLKTAPPVKRAQDRAALWAGLTDGSISFVTTDHAGCDPLKEKSSENFWEIYGGVPGVEHRVPYMLSEGVLENRLTLERTIELLCGNPAAFLGLDARKGSLQFGQDADFALVDIWGPSTISAATMHSKGKYTPFEGLRLGATVKRVWLRGVEVTGGVNPSGEYCPREHRPR